jgi:hypothetical protein
LARDWLWGYKDLLLRVFDYIFEVSDLLDISRCLVVYAVPVILYLVVEAGEVSGAAIDVVSKELLWVR